jgi:succinate dehydrogenase / fumarate reductase cytochrome b subunit
MSTSHDAAPTQGRSHFYLRRLHSLSGVVPLGLFLIEHLWTNLRAVYGREAFNHAVGEIQSMPLLVYIEVFGIFLPLLFHALYGVVIAAQARPNAMRYGFARNWMYVFQRVSGIVAFGFIAKHLYDYRVQKLIHGVAWQNFYDQLSVALPRGGLFALYFVGITATVFHFANGLWLFGNTWGITLSPLAMRRSAALCSAVGVALWAIGINVLIHFGYACGGLLPMPEQQVERTCQNADITTAQPPSHASP